MFRTACVLTALAIPTAAYAQCQLQKLLPAPNYSGFGIFTFLSPDYGAVVSDAVATYGTTVALYRRDGNTLTSIGPLLPSEGFHPNITRYGHGLAIAGATLVASDYMANSFAGRVYTFVDSGAGFAQQTTLTGPPGVQAFGYALATDGAHLVVTSTFTAPNGGPGGNAWAYERTPAGWSLIQSDFNTSGLDGAEFGTSIAMDAGTVAIGAPDQFDPGYYGSVYIYSWNGAQYIQEGQAEPPVDPFPAMGFGAAVALSGDLLFVGAPDRPFTGQVYIYHRAGGVWTYASTVDPGTFGGNEFGRRIAFLPESSLLLVSAEGENTTADTAGAVYLFQIAPDGAATPLGRIVPDDVAEGQRFGSGLAASNGLALIGARSDVDGSAYVFLPTGPCPSPCGPADYNGDGDVGTDQDIEAFFACLGGNCCATCWPGGADFNGDGDVGTDQDIEAYFRVLGGGAC